MSNYSWKNLSSIKKKKNATPNSHSFAQTLDYTKTAKLAGFSKADIWFLWGLNDM